MKLHTVEEVAALFSVNVETVRRWLREGTLTGARIGKRWYVTEESLKARLEVNGQSE